MADIPKNSANAVIVLDASAAVDVLMRREPKASSIRERIGESEENFHVPHLFEIGVLNSLRRLNLTGDLTETREAETFEDLSNMRLTRHPHTPFIERIWEPRENVTAYDAA